MGDLPVEATVGRLGVGQQRSAEGLGECVALVVDAGHDDAGQGSAAPPGGGGTDAELAAGAVPRADRARSGREPEAAARPAWTASERLDAVEQRVADLELGAGLSRHELNVRLEGDGARLVANGVLLADGKRHLDTRLGIEHIARDTACELLWRGLGADRGRAVFHGGITIREGADGTDANLSNKNLLLSANAEVDTQPVLVIHADEVKAAHGATVGQIDPTALFYLRSRGIPAEQARAMLTAAFCREVLGALDAGPLHDALATALDARLAALGAA